MKKFILAVFLSFVFFGCAKDSVKKENIALNNGFENRSFTIYKVILNGKELDIKKLQENPNITFENNKFYGFSGCNRFFGVYSIKNGSLKIEGDRVASTQMLCHPLEIMDFENAFLSNFNGEFSVNYNSSNFVLENKIMQIYFK